jgi:RAB protein geranylgeranyltransferase component A
MTDPTQSTDSSTEASSSRCDGILSHYDVVLSGTSLTLSVLASALARAGYSVLHCDGADFYGELDAVWTLPYIIEESKKKESEKPVVNDNKIHSVGPDDETSIYLSPLGSRQNMSLHSQHSRIDPDDFPFEQGIQVDTPYGSGTVKSIDIKDVATNISIALDTWKLADGSNPTLHISVPESNLDDKNKRSTLANRVFEKNAVLHSTCRAARQLLLQHSRSFALDITPGLIFCSGTAVQGLITSSVSEYLEFKALEGMLFGRELQKVPCNKNDVFSSKLLKVMDKRRLMQFLQLAMDYATAKELEKETQLAADDSNDIVQSLNERHLNQGRSLKRPQNKQVASDDMQNLKNAMVDGMSFRDYLKEQKLSETLIDLVRYAMALETNVESDSETSLTHAMDNLSRHLMALGRFGTTAFLVPLYGSGELPQAFCRSAAVYGAAYMLRTVSNRISWSNDENANEDSPISVSLESLDDHFSSCTITCSNFICSQQSLVSATATHRVWRRISVLSGKPIAGGQQRHVIILPPHTLANHPYVIQGIILDQAVNVAPHAPSCSVLHLTTTLPIEKEHDELVLQLAVEHILKTSQLPTPLEEVFHISFSYDLLDGSKVSNIVPSNVHLVHHDAPGLAVDSSFDQAKAIFESICPSVPFLTVAEKVTQSIKETLGDAALDTFEDVEQLALESAMGMLDCGLVSAEAETLPDDAHVHEG